MANPQTNEQNKKILNFLDLICECILIFCGREKRKHKQTNQIFILIYKKLIIFICGFVCTFCGHRKKKKKKNTDRYIELLHS